MEKTAIFKRKRLRLIPLAMIAACLFVFVFSTFVSAEYLPITFKTTKDSLNIRTQPDTYSELLTVIEKKGTLLYPVEQVSDNWYKIRFAGGVNGYVFRDYVETGDALKSSVSLFPGAALRTGPSDSSVIQKMCSISTEMSIVGQDGNWYKATSFRGETGYVLKSSVVNPIKSYPEYTPALPEVPAIEIYKVKTSTTAKVRTGPGTGNSILTEVANGELITVTGKTKGTDGNDWYKITVLNGKTGYIRGDLVATFDTSILKGKTIVIDPGHGSIKTEGGTIDNGNVGIDGVLEKDLNLPMSQYLQAYLVKAGATVVMTRTADKGYMSLADRAAYANSNNADILISVHCNRSNDAKVKGSLVYYSKSYYNNGKLTEYAANAAEVQKRLKLANAVQNSLLLDTGANNAGIKHDSLAVLNRTIAPSIYAEPGYMSNAEEEKLLTSYSYQILCAQGMYKGILKYFE